MRIQHNILAMNAYRNYNTNTSALAKNLEKLSSGYKINRAGDDAAGLAISEKMRAQITGLNAAQKNVKDGISLVKTAEGAMQEIQDMLNRMDYLATQSANGTYDNEIDRMNLNKEMDALKSEIDRIADSANFNGIKLLDGSLMDDPVVSQDVTIEKTETFTLTTGTSASPATCGQWHKAGVASQQAKFEIDLKQALHGVRASKSIAQGASVALKVNVGNATITVKFTATKAFQSGDIFTHQNLTLVGIATAGGTIAAGGTAKASISLTGKAGAVSTKASFHVSVTASGVLKFEMKASKSFKDFDANMKVTITGSKGLSMAVNGSANKGAHASGVVSYNCNTQNITNGVAKKGTQLAHVHISASEIAAKLAALGSGDAGVLTIGGENITFDTESNTTAKNTIGIKDLLDSNGKFNASDSKAVAELARRISVAAHGNKAFTVGVGTNGTTISLQEKWDYNNGKYDEDADEFLDSEDKINKLVNWGLTSIDNVKSGSGKKSLTLQIGDTSDDFNRLKVSIGDMHVKAMGMKLDDNGKITAEGQSIRAINIKTADAAKDAIDVIKNAINYVSAVRGDLGATQNRLEHTANNLSVMAENIQDAESTIRDTDIAEEMMSYTKNNILVQSAQAMLAQANAVPQGVLQLLG